MLLETGGGLKKAGWFFNDDRPFLLHNVDVLSGIDLKEIYKYHIDSGALATLAVIDTSSARKILFDSDLAMQGWRHIQTGEVRPAGTNPALFPGYGFSGIHIVDSRFPQLMIQKGKFSIIDSYIHLCQSHLIKGFVHPVDQWIDIGNPESLRLAEKLVKNNLSN